MLQTAVLFSAVRYDRVGIVLASYSEMPCPAALGKVKSSKSALEES